MLGDAREHARTDLFAIVKCEHEVRPAGPSQNLVRTGLALERPTDPVESCEVREWPWTKATNSCSRDAYGDRLRLGFLVLKAIG